MRKMLIVALAAGCSSLAGCGSSKSSPPAEGSAAGPAASAPASRPGKTSSMTKFTLNVDGEPPVAVEFAVPAGWSADTSMPDPAWKRAGARLLSVVAVAPSGGDDAVRVRKAIRMQYDEVGADERTDLPDGRVWIAHQDGENLHARMFVPYPGGVVMGVAILGPDGAGALPEARAAFETLRVVGP